MIAFLALTASAGPHVLPEMVVKPDPLEPAKFAVQSDPVEDVVALDPPPVQVHIADPGDVVMLVATVDTPPVVIERDDVAKGPTCDLVVAIDREGKPDRVRVERCDDEASARKARRSARDLRFEPAVYDGHPVAVADLRVSVTVPSQTTD